MSRAARGTERTALHRSVDDSSGSLQ
jgi:hypothetical protein